MLRSRSLGPRTLRANATFRSRAATGNSRGRTKRGSPGSRRGRGSTGSRQLADSGKLRARRALREASPLKPRVGGIFVTGVCRWVRRVDPCGNKTSTNRRRANRIRFSRQRRVKKRGGGAIRLITVKRPPRPAGGPGPATVHDGGKREQTPRARRFPVDRVSRDSAPGRKARTNGARIAGGPIRSGRDGSRKSLRPLRSSISGDTVKRTAPP